MEVLHLQTRQTLKSAAQRDVRVAAASFKPFSYFSPRILRVECEAAIVPQQRESECRGKNRGGDVMVLVCGPQSSTFDPPFSAWNLTPEFPEVLSRWQREKGDARPRGRCRQTRCSFPSDALRRLQTESQSEEERVVEVLRRGSEPGKERFTTESVVSCFCPVYFCVQFPWWQQISSSSHAAQTLSGFIIQLILNQILHSLIVIQICQTFISSNVSSVFLSLL